jgi:POT family proton-dependent oligopeptide transporter
VAEKISWRLGFGVAGLGMMVGVVQYLLGARHLGSAGLYPAPSASPEEDRRLKRNTAFGAAAALGICALVGILSATGTIEITPELISNALGVILVALAIVVFYWLLLGKGWSPEERKRSGAILVLFLASAVFWSAFEQAGSSLSLFAERSTNRFIGTFQFPASWFQSVQPILVIAMAPVFAWLWLALGKRQPSSPAKFTLGLLGAGLGFALLVPAAGGTGVSYWWLIGTYFIHTLGELCLSPVGLSSMTKLAPARLGGFVMGMWFFATAIGNYMAGRMASLYESMTLPSLFGTVALFALGAAAVLALMIKPTVRLMSGVK